MALSILHRASGIALTIGTLLLTWWLVAAAAGRDAFETAQGVVGSVIGQILLFGWTLALFLHLCSGIRHLVWDTGYGFGKDVAETTGWMVAGAAAALTVVAWILAYTL